MLRRRLVDAIWHAEERGLFGTDPAHTRVHLLAQGRSTGHPDEPVAVEFVPGRSRLRRGDCYRVYGVGAGATKLTGAPAGAEEEMPLLQGYGYEHPPSDWDGRCP